MTAFWRTKTEGPQGNTELREVQFTINDMTLRDYFAAKAMEGHVAARHGDYELFKPEGVAAWAYVMADAMMKEREK